MSIDDSSIPQYVTRRRLSHLKEANAIKCCNKLLLRNMLGAWKVDQTDIM